MLRDGSYKTVRVDPKKTTVEDLWNVMCEKMGLSDDASSCFYIWGKGKKLGLFFHLLSSKSREEYKCITDFNF